MLKRICIVILVLTTIVGCGQRSPESDYASFVNDNLDKSRKAFENIHSAFDTAVEKGDLVQLKQSSSELAKIADLALKDLRTRTPPETFTKERDILVSLFISEKEYADHFGQFSTGDLSALNSVEIICDSMINYYAQTAFSSNEYVNIKYKETLDNNKQILVSIEKVQKASAEAQQLIEEQSKKNRTEYLKDTKDYIDSFFIGLQGMTLAMGIVAIDQRSAKDSAETAYSLFDKIQTALAMKNPPEEFKSAHEDFTKAVDLAKQAAEYITLYVRTPNDTSLSDKATDNIKAIENYLQGVAVLKAAQF